MALNFNGNLSIDFFLMFNRMVSDGSMGLKLSLMLGHGMMSERGYPLVKGGPNGPHRVGLQMVGDHFPRLSIP